MKKGDLDNITIENDSIDDEMYSTYKLGKIMPFFIFDSNFKDLYGNYTRTHLVQMVDG